MELDGGGWTALVNPTSASEFSPFTWAESKACTERCSNCGPHVNRATIGALGYQGFLGYVCGNMAVEWYHEFMDSIGGATDLAFEATVQGQSTAWIQVYDGQQWKDVSPSGISNAYMRCEFWNGDNHVGSPSRNGCYEYVDPALNSPMVFQNLLKTGLMIKVKAGRACEPDCQHGAGYHVSSIMIR